MAKDSRLKKFFISIIIVFVLMTVGTVWALTYVIINQCESYMLTDTSALISADASQLQLNINSYLENIEGNVALMFADGELMNYDASTTKLDEYDRIKMESSIADRIVDLGALENYGDFCVVYANDNTVGWKSKTTQNMYSDGGIYTDMCSYIKNNRTEDGWAFGVQGNYDRMYYIKRYNPNAVIIASFYTRELEKTFDYPEELEGMNVRLVDDNGYIVYSSDTEEIGNELDSEAREYYEKKVSLSAVTDTQLVNTNLCNNGWMVMCTISKESIMQKFYDLRKFAFLFSTIVIIVAILILVVAVYRLTRPMDGYVDDLSEKATIDVLSGVMNRRAYEEYVSQKLADKKYKHAAFVMFDIDNFKKVNDTLGHDYGDDVIARMGALLSRVCVESDIAKPTVGRIGGDEFTAFIGLLGEDPKADITGIMDSILREFDLEFEKERQKLPLSLSAGVALDSFDDYQCMYNAADSALYVSKESGKNQYNFYEEDIKDEA